MNNIVIGICGGTGSGKTTLAKQILKAFPDKAVILSHDYYYKSNNHLTYDERIKQNYDHPDAFDTELLIEHIKALKNGEDIMHPTYNFVTHLRNDEWVLLKCNDIIIIEGILLFENIEICDLLDIKLYVDTDADVRFIRRLQRDVKDRGRTMQSVIEQYLNTVKPMHEQFVEPFKRRADIIIPEGAFNMVAIDLINDSIRKKLLNKLYQ